jgi:hypothetical protein
MIMFYDTNQRYFSIVINSIHKIWSDLKYAMFLKIEHIVAFDIAYTHTYSFYIYKMNTYVLCIHMYIDYTYIKCFLQIMAAIL